MGNQSSSKNVDDIKTTNNRIIDKFLQIKQMGTNGLKSFWLSFFSDELCFVDVEGGEIKDPGYYVCWNGLYYFRWNFGQPRELWNKFPNKVDISNIKNTLNNLEDGLYYFELITGESHYIALYIKDDRILLGNTYGGVPKLFMYMYEKDEWINSFSDIIADYSLIEEYLNLFGITKNDIGFPLPDKKPPVRELAYYHHKNPNFFLYDTNDGKFNLEEIYKEVVNPKI